MPVRRQFSPSGGDRWIKQLERNERLSKGKQNCQGLMSVRETRPCFRREAAYRPAAPTLKITLTILAISGASYAIRCPVAPPGRRVALGRRQMVAEQPIELARPFFRAPSSSTGGFAPGIVSASQCAHFTGK
jgi:hypothetical protein